jgi:hypothetical protein
MNPADVAELILIFEGCALEAEREGTWMSAMDAECIRRNAEGLIEAIATVEKSSPGYAAECIRVMKGN